MYQTVYGDKSAYSLNPVVLEPEALIIGGGVVGLTAARGIAREGMRVVIAERGETLGGGTRGLHFFYDRTADVRQWLDELISAVEGNDNITILRGAKLRRFEGRFGHFQAMISINGGEERTLSPSAVVLATGCSSRPSRAINDDRVIGLSEMERLLDGSRNLPFTRQGQPVKRAAFILDQTDEDIKIHSVNAVKQAVILQEMGCQTAVVARDLKVSAAGMEILYRRAREKGVLFFKYDEPPVLSPADDGIHVKIEDMTVLRKEEREIVALPCDLVVVAETFTADPATEELCRLLRIRPGAGGRLTEDNPQLQRVASNRRGIFLAGACRFPQIVSESLTEARAVVQEVMALLGGGAYTPANPVAEVDPLKCAVCYTCARLCPHAAIGVERYGEKNVYAGPAAESDGSLWGAARVEPAACFGCGICVAECPARAITLCR